MPITLNRNAHRMDQRLQPKNGNFWRNYIVLWAYASKLLLSVDVHNLLSVAVTKCEAGHL